MDKKTFWLVGVLALALVLGALASGSAAAAAPAVFPDTIPLPNGFQPEGVAVGRGTVIYAGSLVDGRIYAANLRTGAGEVLVPGNAGATVAVGLSFDARNNYLFVAGGPLGDGRVYDATTGALLEEYTFSTGAPFINDVIVTRDAAYFTNSAEPEIYRVALGPGGQLADTAEVIPLSGPADFVPGSGFNSNGIEATPDGRYLIIVNSVEAALYRVDPGTGDSVLIDLGEPLPNGDGLLLVGRTLYVVQNFLNQIAVVELNSDFTAGEIVGTITDSDFDIPTTVDRLGNRLYAVNARFTTPGTDTTEYDIIQVRR